MKIRTIIALLAAAALAAGCSKKVTYDTTYVLKPMRQVLSNDPIEPFEGAKAYLYDVDTLEWTVATYEDALAGVITSKSDPSLKRNQPTAVAEPYTEIEDAKGWLQMPFGAPVQMIVAVDDQSRIYAYTQQQQIINLPSLYVSLIFKAWKPGLSYKEANWSFYNNFYEPPVLLKCYITPRVQHTEGGEPEQIAEVKAYAYAVDTTAWYIASYDDAVSGKITSKSNPADTRTTPNFMAYAETAVDHVGSYVMTVDKPMLMIVVADRSDKLYAYTKKEVVLEGESPDFPITFRPWTETWIQEEEGWVVVDESRVPKDPVEPGEPETPAKR